MKVWPLKFRELNNKRLIFADDSGEFFTANEDFLIRYATSNLSDKDYNFLSEAGLTFENEADLPFTSFAYRWSNRLKQSTHLNYLILVPTLRCNLSCSYCQVSRVAETARGFDWTPETLRYVLEFLDELQTDEIKIEFQGGEPLLRIDLLETVRNFCRQKFDRSEFVVCTNLQSLGEAEWSFLEAVDTHISTSIDGDHATHERQRTADTDKTDEFFHNLNCAIKRLGTERISALPTIDVLNPPDFEKLIQSYEKIGLNSIFLRPVNYQGFARKLMPRSGEIKLWTEIHSKFIDFIIERNYRTNRIISEYYFTQALHRILKAGIDGHVDLRNPNFLGDDYIVIDYDGKLFPTDEARMLHRTKRIDLNVGDVRTGIDKTKIEMLNMHSLNNFDADCVHCVYQPYCATDIVDDLSRNGRIDLPRGETWFCKRHLSLFDKAFELLYSEDAATKFSLAAWLGLSKWVPENVRSIK